MGLNSHGHDDPEVVVTLAGLDHRRVELAGDLDAYVVRDHLGEEVGEVARVESHRERLTLVLDLELLAHLAELGVVAGDAEEPRLEAEAHAARLRRHERGTLQRLDQRAASDDGDLLVRLRDDLLVGRELRLDELHRERDVAGLDEDVRSLERERDAVLLALDGPLDLDETLLRDDDAGGEDRTAGERPLDLRQAVAVRGNHARAGAVALEEDAVQMKPRFVVR